MIKIVGISLVKNEDRFVQNSLESVIDFCDKIIVLDNNSSDNTFDILQKLKNKYPEKIILQKIENAVLSHTYIEKYAGTPTWIFGVDGDEIYDKNRLSDFKKEIISGKYEKYFQIFGNCLHVEKINELDKEVSGYLSPPSKSITKLYNFGVIFSWEEHAERLHGNNIRFKPGFSRGSILKLFETQGFDNAIFRCLHMCFLKRSSFDKKGGQRFNPTENSKWYFPVINFLRNIFRGDFSPGSSYKMRKYRRGEIVKFSYKDFIDLGK